MTVKSGSKNGPSSLPHFEKWDAESKLIETIERVKRSSNIESMQNKLLGDFWENSWTRAPFEECLTLKQFLSIDPEVLVRKRSLNAEKMTALAAALNRCITGERPKENASRVRTLPSHSDIEWKRPNREIPSSMSALLRLYEIECSQLDGTHQLYSFLSRLPETIDAESFLSLWLTLDSAPAAITLGMKDGAVKKLLSSARLKLKRLLERTAPDVVLHWNTALSGPGASEDVLFNTYRSSSISREFESTIMKMAVWSLGGERPVIKGRSLPGHWTLSPKTAEKILKAFSKELKGSKAKLLQILSLPFPLFDLNTLIEHLKVAR